MKILREKVISERVKLGSSHFAYSPFTYQEQICVISPTQQILKKILTNYRKVVQSKGHGYRLACPDTPDRYSSNETKLDANLCLSSAIIQSLRMIVLRRHGGAQGYLTFGWAFPTTFL